MVGWVALVVAGLVDGEEENEKIEARRVHGGTLENGDNGGEVIRPVERGN